jgi:hypothetical protein
MSKLFSFEDESIVDGRYLEEDEQFNEIEKEYLNNLDIPLVDEVSFEGYFRALGGYLAGDIPDTYVEAKGYLLGAESKRRYTHQKLDDLLDYIKEIKEEYPDMKFRKDAVAEFHTSAVRLAHYRFLYLLDDKLFNEIMSSIKKDEVTMVEKFFRFDFSDKIIEALEKLHLQKPSDFDSIIKKYKSRVDQFYDAILKRKAKIRKNPFQVILVGAVDLKILAKWLVRMAK